VILHDLGSRPQTQTDHPEVQIICCDRASAYAEAPRQAAPQTVHVADAWHLWNVRREAPIDRVEVGDLRRCPVAAGR
jgi:transposase